MLSLNKIVSPIISNQELWNDFLDVTTDLFSEIQTEIEDKSKYLTINEYTDTDELLQLARSLGYSPNLILKNNLDYLRKEVESIVFKIKNKSTYYYYDYIFKLIPYPGETFILFQDHSHLIRAIDYPQTYTNLAEHDPTKPFTGFETILHYDTTVNQPIELDANPLLYLDALILWYLDQDKFILPTNHIAVEYEIDRLYTDDSGKEYLLYPDYFDYLRTSVDYGRKVVNVPHTGGNVSFIMEKNECYDSYNFGADYSIADIKSSAAVTNFLRAPEERELIYLDEGETLDDTDSVWYLDQDDFVATSEKEIEEIYNSLKVGTGTKNLYSILHRELLYNMDLHISFEDPNTTTLTDVSRNANDISILGTYNLIQSDVSGKTVSLNGVDTTIKTGAYISSYQSQTWCLWIKGNEFGQLTDNPRIIYQNNFINVYYNVSSQVFSATLIGGTASETVTFTGTLDKQLYFFLIEIDDDDKKLRLYVNDEIQDVGDISGIGVYNSDKDLWVGSQAQSNYFRGYVDEFRIYDKLLDSEAKSYLYDNKLGSHQYLSKQIFNMDISTNQVSEGNSFESAVGWYPAKTIKGEVIGTGDGNTNTFNTILDYNQLKKGYLRITYISTPESYSASDNGEGSIYGDKTTGSIDYDTGEITVNTYREYSELREVISEEPITEIDTTVDYLNITPETFELHFWIGDTELTATDDGDGNITGSGISTGSINYSTGALQVTFTAETDEDKDVYVAYDYTLYSTPTDGADVYAEYKVNQDLEITEAGIADNDGNLVTYATFPPVKFHSILDHFSFQFFIRK